VTTALDLALFDIGYSDVRTLIRVQIFARRLGTRRYGGIGCWSSIYLFRHLSTSCYLALEAETVTSLEHGSGDMSAVPSVGGTLRRRGGMRVAKTMTTCVFCLFVCLTRWCACGQDCDDVREPIRPSLFVT
jgi:hypothetical protein